MIRTSINPGAVRVALARSGRVQIANYLEADAAERLHECLLDEVPWQLAFADEEGAQSLSADEYGQLSLAQRQALLARLAASAAGGAYRFAYDNYPMPRAYVEAWNPSLLLHPLFESLNSDNYLAFMRALTGLPTICRVTAQATAYRPGQFLRQHTDISTSEGREYAFVLNLSRDWRADWGGLLQFATADGVVTDTFHPRWNSLSLFKVPTDHLVSMVTPWAEQPRLAITGWLLSS